ncbi:MAG: TnsA endonuclease N-terminal domain-containing protein [Candidatus Hydrothermarchaeales archaeon]
MIEYERPEPARKIPLKWGSNRGRFYCTKPHLFVDGKPHKLEYESTLEYDFYLLLDHDPNSYDIQYQPFELYWKDDEDNEHPFYPDTWAIFTDATQVLFQVKRRKKLEKLKKEQDIAWKRQCEELERYCREKGWIFRILTEEEIRTTRLRNVELLRCHARNPPSVPLIVEAKKKIASILKKASNLSKEELSVKLSKTMKIPMVQSIAIVECIMFRDFFYFDWDTLVSDSTPLSIRSAREPSLEPVHSLKPMPKAPDPAPSIPVDEISDRDLDVRGWEELPEDERKIAEKSFDDIEPLIEKRLQDKLTLKDVEARAEEVDVCKSTLYELLRRYMEDGKRGLLPRNRFKGNRSPRVSPKVEELMAKVAREHYYKRYSRVSKRRCYEYLKEYCDEFKLPHPSYSTFNERLNRVPNTEIMGTQNDGMRNGIARSLTGAGTPQARRPLDLVYADHTELNISLVDQVYGKPIGRPYLTLAMDSFSRKVYGFCLGLEDVSSLSVGITIVRGILPKDELLEKYDVENQTPWEIHGLPQKLKWDNDKVFDSKGIEGFCGLHSINHEFSPVKRPDSNGTVETFFGTIKNVIQDDALPGYAIPLEKKPSNYNPDKKAALTLQDLEKWLISFFMEYHNKPHESLLGKTPREKYLEGMGGQEPYIPKNPGRLWFDVLPSKTPTLQRYGVRCNGLNYTSTELMRARKHGKDKERVKVRIDRQDIRFVYWFDEDKGKYVAVPMKGAAEAGLIARIKEDAGEIPPLSVAEFGKIKAQLKEEGVKISPFNIKRARGERLANVREGAKKSKRLRRENAKIEYSRDNTIRSKLEVDEIGFVEEEWEEGVTPAKAVRWGEKESQEEEGSDWDEEIVPAKAFKWNKKGVMEGG